MVSEHSVRITTEPRSRYSIQLPLPVTNEDLAALRVKDTLEWRMMLDLAQQQETWIQTVKAAHGLTNKEMIKHGVIHETITWPKPEDTKLVITLTLEIHWTRWMRFKRWWRGK